MEELTFSNHLIDELCEIISESELSTLAAISASRLKHLIVQPHSISSTRKMYHARLYI